MTTTPTTPPPTRRLACATCGHLTPHRCRPDLQGGPTGLLWECARCGRQTPRSTHQIATAEQLPWPEAPLMAPPRISRCKAHGYAHAYTVCPHCQHQYCERTWRAGCPRCAELRRFVAALPAPEPPAAEDDDASTRRWQDDVRQAWAADDPRAATREDCDPPEPDEDAPEDDR